MTGRGRGLLQRAALCVLLLAFFLPAPSVRGEEAPVVRVGWFSIDGYQYADEGGGRGGYGFEYYQEIARYLPCRYEYVPGTWQECLQRLERGEIDVLSMVTDAPRRRAAYDLTDTSLGWQYAQLTARADDQRIVGGNAQTIDGLRVGALRDADELSNLADWLAEQGVACDLTLYGEADELLRALETGEVDLLLGGSFRRLEAFEQVAFKMNPGQIYLAVRKGDDQLLRALNDALAQIRFDDPLFGPRLQEKYYAANAARALLISPEERAFLDELPALRVVAAPDRAPISYVEDGHFSGINADIFAQACELLGIEYEYIPTSDYEETLRFVRTGEADVLCGCYYDYSWAEQNGLYLSAPFLHLPYSMAKKLRTTTVDAASSIAAVPDLRFTEDYVLSRHPLAQIVWCDTIQACIDAVNQGVCDAAYGPSYAIEYCLKDYHYSSMASTLIEYGHDVAFAVSGRRPAMLATLLGKAIASMGDERIDEIVMAHTAFQPHDLGWLAPFYETPALALSAILLMAALLLGLLAVILLGKNRHNAQLVKLIETDHVTGGMSFEKFRAEAGKLLASDASHYALAYTDIQNFKYINDTFGHEQGDRLLTALGGLLSREMRPGELVARAYADHFSLLLKCEDRAALEARIRSLWADMDREVLRFSSDYGVFFKTGACFFLPGAADVDRAADAAIYALGTLGALSENALAVYDGEMHARIAREKTLERDMHAALERCEFEAYFQPKVDLKDRRIVGAEALVRWRHPEMGLISPGEFIPFFERNGFVTKLDLYMFEQACRCQRALLDADIAPVPVSVNFSRRHLRDGDWSKQMAEIVRRYDLPAQLIELELTETVAEEDFELVAAVAERIKAGGFGLSIDDFGSGFSSVQLLYKIPIDVLKLDKSCLHEGGVQDMEREIVMSLIDIALANGIRVIWEGIETPEQEQFIKAYGCRYAQGFLYARPMPFDDYMRLLKDQGAPKE